MRVGQFGGDVELEVIVIRYDAVSQLDHKTTSLLEGLRWREEQYGRGVMARKLRTGCLVQHFILGQALLYSILCKKSH